MSSCKYCKGEKMRINDYTNKCFRVMKNEYGVYQLTTMYGEVLMKINFCPKCGRKLEEGKE